MSEVLHKPVGATAGATKLRTYLVDKGITSIEVSQARSFLGSLGLDGPACGLALGHGAGKNRKLWKIADGTLTLVNKNGAVAQEPSPIPGVDQEPPPVPVPAQPALTPVVLQLESLFLGQGCTPGQAKAASVYLAQADTDDLRDFEQNLGDLTEISASIRKRILRLWARTSGKALPEDAAQAPVVPAARQYVVALNGDLLPLPTGEEGLSLAGALAQQQLVVERLKAQQPQGAPAVAEDGFLSKIKDFALDRLVKGLDSPAVMGDAATELALEEARSKNQILREGLNMLPSLLGNLGQLGQGLMRYVQFESGQLDRELPRPLADLDSPGPPAGPPAEALCPECATPVSFSDATRALPTWTCPKCERINDVPKSSGPAAFE